MGACARGQRCGIEAWEDGQTYLESRGRGVEGRPVIRPVTSDRHGVRLLRTRDTISGPPSPAWPQRTRYSSVSPMSRIDFDPAQTTTTGVSLRLMRSLEMSKPVCATSVASRTSRNGTRTRLGPSVHSADSSSREDLDASEVSDGHRARDRRPADHLLLAAVPCQRRFSSLELIHGTLTTAAPSSRRPTFQSDLPPSLLASKPFSAKNASSFSDKPTLIRPPMMAIVAGVTPCARRMFSHCSGRSTECGGGRPGESGRQRLRSARQVRTDRG